jgi:two-component system response regulator LytT
MVKKKILVVEDDVFIAEQLSVMLSELGYCMIGIATTMEMAIEIINETPPDLALLDIKMHGINQGFGVANYLIENGNIPFVFVTSFADKETVIEASTLNPVAYIVKPFSEQDVYSTLEIAFSNIDKKKTHLTLSSDRGKFKIPFSEILWIKADNKYLEVKTVDANYLYRSTLSEITNSLDNLAFCRVHRSYIVNRDQVELFKGRILQVAGFEIPISRSYLAAFKEMFEKR